MMALLFAVVFALGAAALMAVATALQHRSTAWAPEARQLSARQVGGFLRAQVAHPLWLLALPADLLGFGLHAVALHFGALSVVQPLLITTLLFALPINHWLRRERMTARELRWAAALVVGLGGFLAFARGPASTPPPGFDRIPAIVAAVLTALVITGCAVAARRTPDTRKAALLGTGAGVAFAVVAALLKACTNLATDGIASLLTTWPLYALVAAGAGGLLLHQLAFQAAPLSASLPAITIVNPLVSVVIGVTVYDEVLRHSAAAILGQATMLLVFAVSGVVLTRLEHTPGTVPRRPGEAAATP